jgi:hypothetical protein
VLDTVQSQLPRDESETADGWRLARANGRLLGRTQHGRLGHTDGRLLARTRFPATRTEAVAARSAGHVEHIRREVAG